MFNSWNEYTMSPTVIAVDTRSWIPDVNGWFNPTEFRYHGFEMIKNKTDITEANGYFNCDKITSEISPEQYLTKSREQLASILNPMFEEQGDNGTCGIYTHMSTFCPEDEENEYNERKKARKYIATLANNRTTLISFERIEATCEAEEKNPDLIQFPVSLNYLSPKPGDPYGTCVPDLSQDKHRYINVMANLMYIKEKNMALGDDYIYNPEQIKNGNDLIAPTLGAKYIPAQAIQ